MSNCPAIGTSGLGVRPSSLGESTVTESFSLMVLYRRRVIFRNSNLRLWVVILLLCSGGCAPVALWLNLREPEQVLRVQSLPPGYQPNAPQSPYAGPHPASLPFDASVFDFPVLSGGVGPIDYSLGPLQYPFACETEESFLGPPLVDNQEGIGTPVYQNDELIGHSKDCLIETHAEYYFKPPGSDRLLRLLPDTPLEDVEYIEINNHMVPFVVRVERGTINRFIYVIAVLADPSDPLDRVSAELWNDKLIYYFRGGVGIGKRQGAARASSATRRRIPELAAGYAVAYSSGTRTSVHYNVWLAANTAAMVKQQFVSLYGEPEYTVGIGESGGAVQQLLIAQNEPGLLDALVPVYAYPDMVTQSIWALDCELLEYYFDITARDQQRWRKQEERTLIEGMAADSDAANLFNRFDFWSRLAQGRLPRQPGGATECAVGWRGLTPLTNNPTYTNHRYRYARPLLREGRWSHWHDLKEFYGVDEGGYAYRTYDNVGVQYGLVALRSGAISASEFLHLNANIGSWKPPHQNRQERYWLVSRHGGLRDLRIWSDHNMVKTPGGATPLDAFRAASETRIAVAPRSVGHLGAIAAAYHSGHVFLGMIDVPVIDVRHYLDDQLNMHHSFASLALRLRLLKANGHSDNHLIWVAEPPFDPTTLALATIDAWLIDGKPHDASDRCLDAEGGLIASGDNVWNGSWNGLDRGACLQRFPAFQSPRDAAGGPLTGDIFKCHLKTVNLALGDGTYGEVDMQPYAYHLAQVFPDGVCDFTQGDAGRPVLIFDSKT